MLRMLLDTVLVLEDAVEEDERVDGLGESEPSCL